MKPEHPSSINEPGSTFDSEDGTDPSMSGPLMEGLPTARTPMRSPALIGRTEEQDAAFKPGTLIDDRYRIETLLGEGGMAFVYRARDERYGRLVALKVMRLTVLGHIARFEREARATAALTHPSVVHIFDYGSLPDNRPFLVLEYVEGDTLIDWLDDEGALPPILAVGMVAPVVGALVEAHDAGIIHRDIKADNLIIQRVMGQGAVLRLLDFSIAALEEPQSKSGRRLTATGQLFGTPEYMAPEQAEGKRATAVADIWAIGVVLRLMVTNQLPFEGRNTPEILYRLVNDPPPPVPESVPEDIREIIDACLTRDPAKRPSAVAVLKKLEAVLARNQDIFHGAGLRIGFTPPPSTLPDASLSAEFAPLGTPEAKAATKVADVGEEADVFIPFEEDARPPRSSTAMLLAGLAVGLLVAVVAVVGLSMSGMLTTPGADASVETISLNGNVGAESRVFGVVPVAESLVELDHGTAALAWLEKNPSKGEPGSRRRLVEALALLNARKAEAGLDALEILLRQEPRLLRDPRVMPALVAALGYKRNHPKAMEVLAEALKGPEAVRVERALLKLAADGRQHIRWRVVKVFRKAGRDDRTVTLTSLRADLRMKSCRARQKAADEMDRIGDPSVIPDLRAAAAGGDCFRDGYIEAIIGRLGG